PCRTSYRLLFQPLPPPPRSPLFPYTTLFRSSRGCRHFGSSHPRRTIGTELTIWPGLADKHPVGEVENESGGSEGEQVGPDSFSTDRKSTRLNSSHVKISYAVFCLKKKKKVEA